MKGSNQVIQAKNLGKTYKIYAKPLHRLLEWASFGVLKKHSEYQALKGITFSLNKGECLGIIGSNGAGKSTLLKIISGVVPPTEGDFVINGKVVSLLELGTGFNPELNGIENIKFSALMLGYDEKFLEERLDAIISFADIGEFINRPIKTYSSGMLVRLAFSLFANLDPDIFIVDEALSVGDMFFQQKCFARIREMMQQGSTLIFVSHDFDAVRKLCDKVIVLANGKIQYHGSTLEGIHYYTASIRKELNQGNAAQSLVAVKESQVLTEDDFEEFSCDSYSRPVGSDFCSKDVEILGIKLQDMNGRDRVIFQWGEEVVLRTLMKAHQPQEVLSNGVLLFDRLGTLAWGSGSINQGYNLGPCKAGDVFISEMKMQLKLQPGKYGITVGVSSPDLETSAQSGIIHDRYEQFCMIEILKFDLEANEPVPFFGVAPIPFEFYRKVNKAVSK